MRAYYREHNMLKPCDTNIKELLRLSEEMIYLAAKGYEEHEDDGCAILYGVLLDSAHQIRKPAETEMWAHIRKGWWKEA